MTLLSKVVTVALNTGTGNQTITGGGFTPKLAIVVTTGLTAVGGVASERVGFGVTDGTNHWCISSTSNDAVGTSNASRASSSSQFIKQTVPGGSVDFAASFVSWNSDGMVINIDTAPGSAFQIMVLFLGGTDIKNIAIGSDTASTSITTKTTSGLGFLPNFLCLGTINNTTETVNTQDSVFHIGAAKSSTVENGSGMSIRDAQATTDTARSQLTDTILKVMTTVGGVDFIADLDSFGSGQFTLNYTNAAAGTSYIFYLAIEFANPDLVQVGSFTAPGSTGAFSVTDPGIRPKVGLFFSYNNAASGSIANHAEYSIGMVDEFGNQAVKSIADENGVGTTNVYETFETDAVWRKTNYNGTLQAEIGWTGFNSNGFELDQLNATNTSLFEILYWAFGSKDVPKNPIFFI